MAENGSTVSRTASNSQLTGMLTSLKLASDGGCQLTDDEKHGIAKQLCDVERLANNPLDEAKLLMDPVEKAISNDPPAGDDIEYIASVEQLKPHLVDAKSHATCQCLQCYAYPLTKTSHVQVDRGILMEHRIIRSFGIQE